MKILTICPSIYPDKFKNMQESFYATASKENMLLEICHSTVTEAFNYTLNKYTSMDFYFMANDDIIFKTPLWDIKLAKKGKITYGTDRIEEGINGQFLMIDGDIARAIGWLQLPTLNKYCGDVVWRFIGEQLDILEYVPEVVIKHDWNGADPDINKEDMGEFAKWLPWAFKDIKKIRRVINEA